jgi:signal transduction histidine kinase
LGTFTIWQLAKNLESVDETLTDTESFLRIERQIETELLLQAKDWQKARGEQIQADIDALSDLPGNKESAPLETLRSHLRDHNQGLSSSSDPDPLVLLEVLQAATQDMSLLQANEFTEHMASARSHLDRALLVEGILLLLLIAITAFMWTRAIRPLNRLLGFLSRSFVPSDSGPRDQRPPSEPRSLSLDDLAQLCELSERESEDNSADLDQQIEVAVKTLLQEQFALAHSEKKTIAAELAASLAHEIRNPLAAIQMSLSNLRVDIHDEELAERVERVSAEVVRIGRLVGQTVEAARLDPESESVICLSDLTDEILRLMKFQLPPSIVTQNKVPRDLHCNLPKESIRRALFNLISNSAGSIGDKSGVIEVDALISDSDLEISVTDNGAGFSEEMLSGGGRALTKNTTSTIGLGLAIVRRIARDAGGDMRLENLAVGEHEQGARVVLLLPSCVDNG